MKVRYAILEVRGMQCSNMKFMFTDIENNIRDSLQELFIEAGAECTF